MKTKRQAVCEWMYRHHMKRIAKLVYPSWTDHLMLSDAMNSFREGFIRGIEKQSKQN